MTGRSITRAPGPARQCARCGALGTHYLTCPLLRLPRGYRVSQDPHPGAPATSGDAAHHPPAGGGRRELAPKAPVTGRR
jgi:hypothetical protein